MLVWENITPLLLLFQYPYFRTYKNSLGQGNVRIQSVNPGDLGANSDDHHSTNLVAILAGTGVGVFVVAMAAIVVAIVMIRRRRGVTAPNEKMQLLSFKG